METNKFSCGVKRLEKVWSKQKQPPSILEKHIDQITNSNTLLESQESCIINAGITTSYFSLKKGVCPGDPVSAYVFILCLWIY